MTLLSQPFRGLADIPPGLGSAHAPQSCPWVGWTCRLGWVWSGRKFSPFNGLGRVVGLSW